MTVTWVNPCKTTSFVASPIPDSFGFITNPAAPVKVPVPWLNDQANTAFGVSATSSICDSQSITVTENGTTPAFLTTSVDAGQNVMQFATTNPSMAGAHTITVRYTLTQYPTITSTSNF